ncbi:MAG: inositol monophosphatase [Gammaproteobacteria bacterium]|uniref:Inositol-1-monophosphatase n=1 Tax=Candidatus Thiopontia autotrophica TaxID=2841688 RepID=A0A8J6P3L7_9GAMM|nr:inositol monophosphatase [Candidatus Thiopontia autotrophica]MBL6969406.1 inositol monophosphatase [Gammaproteobacteria bacterium]
MNPMLNTAVKAARRAGSVILRSIDRLDALNIESKGKNDFVSEVDRKAEAEIIKILHQAYPDHSILAEENGSFEGNEYKWIIDPLDGTTNYLHGFPVFSVSIALAFGDNLLHAVVYDPLRDELFTASKGDGAMLNNRRIRTTNRKGISGSLLGTGFPFKDQQHLEVYMETFKALFPDSAGIRRAGSAAIDLAYVAAGRLDGFWEIGLNPWDIAAGALLVSEAGGVCSDFSGGADFLKTGNVIAGGLEVHGAIQKTIAPLLPNNLKR